ncbi:Hypothetical protein D9617_2g055000 [Elsinoe fawcettii]|nr:Hypothetical protein D9617_2g055000 [Elsinoe fawcettii]
MKSFLLFLLFQLTLAAPTPYEKQSLQLSTHSANGDGPNESDLSDILSPMDYSTPNPVPSKNPSSPTSPGGMPFPIGALGDEPRVPPSNAPPTPTSPYDSSKAPGLPMSPTFPSGMPFGPIDGQYKANAALDDALYQQQQQGNKPVQAPPTPPPTPSEQKQSPAPGPGQGQQGTPPPLPPTMTGSGTYWKPGGDPNGRPLDTPPPSPLSPPSTPAASPGKVTKPGKKAGVNPAAVEKGLQMQPQQANVKPAPAAGGKVGKSRRKRDVFV